MAIQTLTLTLIGKSGQKSEQLNQRKGKKGNGVAYLAVARHRSHAGTWGKRKTGRGSARRDPATEAPRPGRSTAARSPAGERARRRGGRQRRQGSTDSPLESLGAAFAALRKESGEDREWRRPNGARVQGRRGGRRFDPPMRAHSRRMERNGRDGVGQVAAQAGARTRGTLPA